VPRQILTRGEYEHRRIIAEAVIEDVLRWMNYNAGSRIENRSYGEASVTFRWEDGNLRDFKISETSLVRRDDAGGLVSAPAKPLRAGSDGKLDEDDRST
jgi:hypothetical protein